MPEPTPINKNAYQVKSPLSDVIILELDRETGDTRRAICPACVKYVDRWAKTHVLDPIYFWGAGIYNYETHVTPLGTKAFLHREALGSFIRSLPYDTKKNWERITGLPFPFKFVKGKRKKAA